MAKTNLRDLLCVFHPKDSNYLILSSWSGYLSEFDLTSHKSHIITPNKHYSIVSDICEISGKIITASGEDVCLWDKEEHLEFREIHEIKKIGLIHSMAPQEERAMVLLCGDNCALLRVEETISIAIFI